MQIPDIIIAIDGYSATGKSTLAKLIASEYSFLYLDSGALYRAVTLFALEEKMIDAEGRIDEDLLRKKIDSLDVHFEFSGTGSKTYIGGRCVEDEIRSMEVSSHVSPVSAIPFVREFVDRRLHSFGEKGRVVMDGRDIGSAVFPEAQVKIFMTADVSVRAKRRFDELVSKGSAPVMEDVIKNLRERDYIDSHREASPLTRASDAFVLDNSEMTLHEETVWFKGLLQGKFGILE